MAAARYCSHHRHFHGASIAKAQVLEAATAGPETFCTSIANLNKSQQPGHDVIMCLKEKEAVWNMQNACCGCPRGPSSGQARHLWNRLHCTDSLHENICGASQAIPAASLQMMLRDPMQELHEKWT